MAEYLTRSFFEEELESLAKAYAQEVGAEEASIELLLKGGVALKVEGLPTCTDGYVTVDYKSGNEARRAVLPYKSIVGVSFKTEAADKRVGFHR